MIESKPWEWSKLNEEGQKKWKEPSIESYYLINRWKKQNKKDFLDIGCGLGRHTIQFAKKGFNVNSIDLSEEAIKTTKEWLEKEGLKANVKKSDMIQLPYKKESIDCILCRNVISHTDTEGIKIIIEQIYNILRKDGECFLTLGSKNAETFKNKNNPQKDENTAIRMDEGPEKRNTTLLCRYKNNTRTI
ncbi:MAG: hypothetical protein BHW01_02555 [Clostridium sp. 27_14]|jgi:ribosomal protein L11 methyltransferase (prmA)|nr:MAG: hypothetical protein BHW01_02555 [Clostridium sp. 27_14]